MCMERGFLIWTYWAVSHYLTITLHMRIIHKSWTISAETHLNTMYKGVQISLLSTVFWKANFSMRFVLLICQCSLLCIKSSLVGINIPPRLLEEPPDCNKFT